jgi:hypothetical protein
MDRQGGGWRRSRGGAGRSVPAEALVLAEVLRAVPEEVALLQALLPPTPSCA